MDHTSSSSVKTRFLVLSDTHGHDLDYSVYHADVAIHCGDLTTGSKLNEFKTALKTLQTIDAPLKLVIAGNHDFTMDIPMFHKKVAEVTPPLEPTLVKREYGDYGEIRELFNQARPSGIVFLDEGTHHFTLQNGAGLKIYASPYTPSLGDWGFQYHPETGHTFNLEKDTDIVITHGPPRGIMDTTYSGERAGCPRLFEAIARVRPRMHCFGHIHEGWGAKVVGWRRKISETPSHFTDVDNGRSTVIGKLSQITPNTQIVQTSHCRGDQVPLEAGTQTLFVNAALEGTHDCPIHPLWQIDLDLPRQH
ncbi:Metallo-dependent phosphatase-like protein [Aspergillus californicus]